MCGRFTLSTSANELAAHFRLADVVPLEARYNIAPTQSVAIIRMGEAGRRLTLARWGLVPFGSSGPRGGAPMINARCETLEDKPSFRWAIEHGRCLVPADGFYEWDRSGGRSRPYHITVSDQPVFGLAGICDRWVGEDGSEIESVAIVTTDANEIVRPIHDRMPVIVSPDWYERWLNLGIGVSELRPLFVPVPSANTSVREVGRYVNSVDNEGPRCFDPPEPPIELDLFE